MLAEGIYKTEINISFELSRVYTAPVVRLWWMIILLDLTKILTFSPQT
jgi:hypothetical protein